MKAIGAWIGRGCLAWLGFAGLNGCSSVSSPVTTTGQLMAKTITTTGSVAGKTAVATVNTSGKVAGAALGATKSIAQSAVKTAFVTVKDAATGVARQVPWTEGMKLYAASKKAEFDAAMKSFEILRGANVIRTDWRKIQSGAADPVLQAGDVITLRPMRGATGK